MATLFISDLHLGHRDPAITEGFEHFLSHQAARADALYILGDFFDAWIGDDDDDELIARIKAQLRAYSAHTPIFFMHGNRDFLVGEDFARDTGCQLIASPTAIDLHGRRALLMHGDTLCTADTEYLEFRAMVRSPQWQQQVLGLPLAQRRQMAADLRDKSQSMNAIKAEDIMDVTPAEVERIMAEAEVDLLIHGHTHRPAMHQLTVAGQPAERWVLGAWHDMGWYLRADAHNGLELVEFAL